MYWNQKCGAFKTLRGSSGDEVAVSVPDYRLSLRMKEHAGSKNKESR